MIICTKNRPIELAECLESIKIQSLKPNEVIIVDDSDNEVSRLVANNFNKSPLYIVYMRGKRHMIASRNLGVKKSSGEIITFLDDDVVLEKDFIQEIATVLEQDEKKTIGAVVGNITNTAHRRRLLRMVQSLFFLDQLGDGKRKPSGASTWPQGIETEVKDVECLSGCCMCFRREIFDQYSFDENTGADALDDVDAAYWVSQRYRIVFTPHARLTHKAAPAEYKSSSRLFWKNRIPVCTYMFRKNMPQTLKNKAAFYLSLLGMVILATPIKRSQIGLLGALEGLAEVFIKGNPSFPKHKNELKTLGKITQRRE